MATPRLKIGDTFVYTEEMRELRDHEHVLLMDDLIGKKLEVTAVSSDYYGAEGWNFPIIGIDSCLPETKPRTLDDVKEGDVLVCLNGGKRLVLGRAGQVVFLSIDETTDPSGLFDSYSLQEIKKANLKFADQPEERWKPEGNYWYVEENSKGEFYSENIEWTNSEIDNKLWRRGNCFKTEAEAEKAAEELKEFWRGRINNQK